MGKELGRVGWRPDGYSVSVVVRSCCLQQSHELPPYLAWKRRWLIGALDAVLIKIDQHKVVIGKLETVIALLHAHNVWARCFESGDESSGKDGNEDTAPFHRV